MSLGYVLIKGFQLDDAIEYMRSKSLRIDRLVESGPDFKFIINYDNPSFNYKMVPAERGVEYYYFDYRSPVEKEPILLINNMLVGQENYRPGKNMVSPQEQGISNLAKIERYKTLMNLLIEYSKIPSVAGSQADNVKFAAMRGELLQKMEPDVTYYDVEFPQQVAFSISELKELIQKLSLQPTFGFQRPIPIHTGEFDSEGKRYKLYLPTRGNAPVASILPTVHSSSYVDKSSILDVPPAPYRLPSVPTEHSAMPYEPRLSADLPMQAPETYSSANVPEPPPLPNLDELTSRRSTALTERVIEPRIAPVKRGKTIQEEIAERASSKEGLSGLLKKRKEIPTHDQEIPPYNREETIQEEIIKRAKSKKGIKGHLKKTAELTEDEREYREMLKKSVVLSDIERAWKNEMLNLSNEN